MRSILLFGLLTGALIAGSASAYPISDEYGQVGVYWPFRGTVTTLTAHYPDRLLRSEPRAGDTVFS
jgi:hypothetical protein